MKNYAKVIGFILLLSFCSFQSNTLAEDTFSPGSGWQEIPAYGPELQVLADWQDTSSSNTADDATVETFYNAPSGGTDSMQPNKTSPITGSGSSDTGNMLGGLMGNSGNTANLLEMYTGTLVGMFYDPITGIARSSAKRLTDPPKSLSDIYGGNSSTKIDLVELQKQIDAGTVSMNISGLQIDDVRKIGLNSANLGGLLGASSMGIDNSGLYGMDKPIVPGGLGGVSLTADFDPCTPGRETKFYSPLVIDTDRSGAIALDGGVIQFDIAPHIAGLETIPVPAPGKDMFLVWDKAGTETIEGAAREYKDGEIVDITELFGPEDYSRSDFSTLAYTDDGFTKLAKLCDVNKDGCVDKQDTALSAEVSAKLKLWSPLSGQLILFKDTDIVVDVRAGSYERHPSDVEGWAVEYKMKDAQGRLLGYQWLSSKTSTPLCVDVLLAVQ